MFKSKIGVVVGVAMVSLVAILALGPATSSSAPGDNAVVHWSGVAEPVIATGRPPASSAVMAGILHGAMYDAVAAVEGGLKPFATDVTAPAGASADAAVAQAARDVLISRIPAQTAAIQAAYDAYMAAIPPGQAREDGKAAGAASAAGMLALRAGDGWSNVVPYVQPTPGPGVFEPIAPGVINPNPPPKPVGTELPFVTPFTYSPQSAYRPAAPYNSLKARHYAQDVAEVQLYGRDTSAKRTTAQTETVRFHTDQTYAQFSRGLRGLVNERGLSLRESARLLGYTWVAVGDTMLACWEAKYYYMLWRPNHAIQRADTDGNQATSPDPTWLPLITGNHPEYPSGHGCFTAGVTTSLTTYFKTEKVQLTLNSVVTGTTRTYERLDNLVAEVGDARVWGGLHYRTTMTKTAKHFPQIARDVGKKHFLGHVKVDRNEEDN